jgi:hypothetical protein
MAGYTTPHVVGVGIAVFIGTQLLDVLILRNAAPQIATDAVNAAIGQIANTLPSPLNVVAVTAFQQPSVQIFIAGSVSDAINRYVATLIPWYNPVYNYPLPGDPTS